MRRARHEDGVTSRSSRRFEGAVAEAELVELFAPFAAAPGPILLAVSGGPDSTALMGLAALWAGAGARADLAVATVDHGLRPGSRREAETVRDAARALGLDHHLLTWTRPDAAPVSQARARAGRYRLLDALATQLRAGLATAHTLDDQAETVLLRMAAGSGPSGLAAMRAAVRRGTVLHHRPFLAIPKARLVATCEAHGWPFASDPTNADDRYARARWRGLLPLLEREGLDAPRLARLASRLARADDALAGAAGAALAEAGFTLHDGPPASTPTPGRLDFRALASHPDEIVIRALRLALGPIVAVRLERLETCVDRLLAASRSGVALRRTVAGYLLTLGRDGFLLIAPEPPRARGVAAR